MEREILYVSPDGNDTDSGDSTSPLETIAGAQNRARAIRLDHPGSGIDIVLLEGVYRVESVVELSSADCGYEHAALRMRSAPGDRVVFTGSRELPVPAPVEDREILSRLSPTARENLRAISCADAGIPDITEISQRGQPPIELYCNGRRLPISRYPAADWLRIEDVPQDGKERFYEGLDRERRYNDVPVGRHYGRFLYPGTRPERWKFHNEIFMHGYWTWDWSDSYQTVSRIDAEERAVYPAAPHHNYGYTTNQRFAFLNVLEEIDGPGKWCFHRETGRIYIWPLDSPDSRYTAAVLREPILRITESNYIDISGVIFTESLGKAIEIVDSENIQVSGCEFTRLGETAVTCSGLHNRIQSNDFTDLGAGGVSLDGGDKKMLLSGHNRIENNHIWNFSRWVRTYQHAIDIDGVSNVAAHNLMHDCPQEAMCFKGCDHLIEYNEIHTVTTETGDSGAIHTGRDYTWRGTILRYNFIHGLAGPGLHGSMGIYLDDFMSATTIYGNIFYQAGRAAFIGGGRDNIVKNNLFINCKASVHVDARGTSWAAYYFDGTYPVLFEAMDAMNFRNPPYSERYPILLELYDDDPAYPKNNRIEANVSFAGKWLDLNDAVRVGDLTHERNYIGDEILCKQLRSEIEVDPYFLNIDRTDPYEVIQADGESDLSRIELGGNVVASGTVPAPRWQERDFTVDPEVAESIGFEQLPFEKIGLFIDEFRMTLPDPKRLGE